MFNFNKNEFKRWSSSATTLQLLQCMKHEDDIKKFRLKNAFAKHLEEKHKDRRGDPTAFSFKVVKTYKKPHERQISEGVRIFSSEADILMNGKSEWMQPAVQRIQMTREVGS